MNKLGKLLTIVLLACLVVGCNGVGGPHETNQVNVRVHYFHTYDSVTGKCILVRGEMDSTTYTIEPIESCKTVPSIGLPTNNVCPQN